MYHIFKYLDFSHSLSLQPTVLSRVFLRFASRLMRIDSSLGTLQQPHGG